MNHIIPIYSLGVIQGGKKWNTMRALIKKAHGKLVSYERSGWRIKNKSHTSELSGTFVFLQYNTIYEKGSGVESIVLLKNSEHPVFKIISHDVTSDRLNNLVYEGLDDAAKTSH